VGILDDIEKIDEEDDIRASLKRMEKLGKENQKLLKDIMKLLKEKNGKRKGGKVK